MDLTAERGQRLFELLIEDLRTVDIPRPFATEGEAVYTRRCLQPWLKSFVARLKFPGLICRGEGAAPAAPVRLLGLPFYPDLAVSHFDNWVVAVEVKFLRGAQRQNSLSTAIGQAAIYRMGGYAHVAVFLVDFGNPSGDEVSKFSKLIWTEFRIEAVVRRVDSVLLPHVAAPRGDLSDMPRRSQEP